MGVHGLWQLLQPTGRPVTLESLEGKVLAVDVSIWLNQTMKGMRDRHGNPLPNAHLLGIFNRVCKLLFYRIRPIFVFDGGVPILKRQTLVSRRQRKEEAADRVSKTARKILNNFMKQNALHTVLGRQGGTAAPVLPPPQPSTSQDADIFNLAPMPSSQQSELEDEEEIADASWEERMARREVIYSEYQNAEEVDINSSDFKALPPEIQHEILSDVKESRKRNHWSHIADLPQDSEDFSKYQMRKLMKQSKLTQQINEVQQEMAARTSGEIIADYAQGQSVENVESRRVISEDTSHFILIKGLSKIKEEEQVDANSEANSANIVDDVEEIKDDEIREIDIDEQLARHLQQEEYHSAVEGENVVSMVTERQKTGQKMLSGTIVVDDEKQEDIMILEREADKKDDDVMVVDSMVQSSCHKLQSKNISPAQGHGSSVPGDSKSRIDEVMIIDSSNEGAYSKEDLEETVCESDAGNTVPTVKSPDSNELKNDQWPQNDIQKGAVKRKSETSSSQNVSADVPSEEIKSEFKLTLPSQHIEEQNVESAAVDCGKVNTREDIVVLSAGAKRQASPVEQYASNLTKKAKLEEKCENETEKPSGPILLASRTESQEKLQPKDLSDRCEVEKCKNVTTEVEISEAQKLGETEGAATSDDDDFVEIIIDPSTAKPDDDLFPADIFSTHPPKPQHTLVDQFLLNEEISPKVMHPEPADDTTDQPAVAVDDDEDDEDEEEDYQRAIAASLDTATDTSTVSSQFEGMSQEELREMNSELAAESRQLRAEMGHQERLAASVTDQMQVEAQELLSLFGIPYLVSPMEAEAQCAELDLSNQTQGTITDDSDIWVFGGQRVYKNFFNQKKHVEFYTASDIESQLTLNRSRLINLALLCGSDYTDGIQGVGPVTAIELLSEFPGNEMEPLVAFRDWWKEAQKNWTSAETKVKGHLRNVSLNPGFPNPAVREAYLNPTVDKSKEKFSWGKPDLDLLREYAKDRLGWTKAKIDEVLLPVVKRLNENQLQRTITSYFPTEFAEPRHIKSKRVKRVLKKAFRAPEPLPETNEDKIQQAKKVLASRKGKGPKGRGARKKSQGQVKGQGDKVTGPGKRSVAKMKKEMNLSESSSGSDSED